MPAGRDYETFWQYTDQGYAGDGIFSMVIMIICKSLPRMDNYLY